MAIARTNVPLSSARTPTSVIHPLRNWTKKNQNVPKKFANNKKKGKQDGRVKFIYQTRPVKTSFKFALSSL